MDFGEIFLADTVVSSRQDSSVVPIRVANNSAGFDPSFPLADLAI